MRVLDGKLIRIVVDIAQSLLVAPPLLGLGRLQFFLRGVMVTTVHTYWHRCCICGSPGTLLELLVTIIEPINWLLDGQILANRGLIEGSDLHKV